MEIFRKLVAKGYSEDEATAAIEMLIEQRVLSDERFAQSYLDARVEKGFGPLKIRAELRERGVKREIIDQLLEASDTNWNRLAIKVRTKKFGKDKPGEWKEKAKQTRFLQSRGFTDGQIMKSLGDV